MEETGRANVQKLGCSFVRIVSAEIFDMIILKSLDQTKNAEEMIVLLKRLLCVDKETNAALEGCLASQIVKKRLAQKCRNDLCISEECALRISEKLLNPKSNSYIRFFERKYRWRYPNISRFFYAQSQNQQKKNLFFEDALIASDIKTAVFCLNYGADANILFEDAFGTWVPLSRAIISDDTVLVKTLLASGADLDKEIVRSESRKGDYTTYTTPRKLAREKGNQEILKLLESHSQAVAKE